MSTQSFFWIQVVVGILILMLILWRRSQNKAPTQLKLRNGQTSSSSRMPTTRGQPMNLSAEVLKETSVGREKILNVFFNYNGHCWDAYEILGVPAGAPPALVESAFKKLISTTAPESRGFIEAAYEAIRQQSKAN